MAGPKIVSGFPAIAKAHRPDRIKCQTMTA